MAESVRADQREAQIGLRVFGIALQGFLEEVFRIGIVESLVQQPAPADASENVAIGLRHGQAKLIVGVAIHSEAPVSFGAEVGIAQL